MNAILKKELLTYFRSVIGYVFLGFFVLGVGFYFVEKNIKQGDPLYNDALIYSTSLFLFLVPALTMRLFAEESRQKTDQLLFTSPVTVTGIVCGKFLAAFILFLGAVAITTIFPCIAALYGAVPVAQIASGILGFILMGGCLISIGLFVSVLTNNQVIAAVSTFAALFLVFSIDSIAKLMPMDRVSSLFFLTFLVVLVAMVFYNATRRILLAFVCIVVGLLLIGFVFFAHPLLLDGVIYKTLEWFSISSRYTSFYLGALTLADIVYYITFSIAFIYLTIHVIEKRRWC